MYKLYKLCDCFSPSMYECPMLCTVREWIPNLSFLSVPNRSTIDAIIYYFLDITKDTISVNQNYPYQI